MNLKKTLLLFLQFAGVTMCFGQKEPVKTIVKTHTSNQYKEFIINDQLICGLTTEGKIFLFDHSTAELSPYQIRLPLVFTHMAKDNFGNLYLVDSTNTIRKVDVRTGNIQLITEYKTMIHAMLFNHSNDLFLVTLDGIVDVKNSKNYFPSRFHNDQIHHGGKLDEPSSCIIDKDGNIWMGFAYGEWGGDLCIYSTTHHEFIEPKINGRLLYFNPVISIFEGNNKVYITSGLMHFETSGAIGEANNFNARLIFESYTRRDEKTGQMVPGEYIGPGTYNTKENCIYFYSQNGIFKGDPDKDLTTIEKWEKIIEPKLNWTSGQANAVGSPMNVLGMQFTSDNDKLIFLTANDGIGIYDGNNLVLVR